MNYIVKSDVDEKVALEILSKHKSMKKKEYSIISKNKINIPYYVFDISIKIKRAFNLKPRVAEYTYWVNAISGKLVKSAGILEFDEDKNTPNKEEVLDKEECKQLAKKNAFKLATRYYKSFWIPEIKVESKGKYYISFWNINAYMIKKDTHQNFFINSFSGEVSKEIS